MFGHFIFFKLILLSLAVPIISSSDWIKFFLAGRVPDLKFDAFSVNDNRFDFKIDSDRRIKTLSEFRSRFNESIHKWCFTHPWVTDNDQL